jgi:hypothetical protein
VPSVLDRRSTFAVLGIDFKEKENAANAAVISSNASRVAVRVIRADEEWIIAKTVCRAFGVSDANQLINGLIIVRTFSLNPF